MATESILPLTINHSSIMKSEGQQGTTANTDQFDPLIDLDSILLSADLQTNDNLLSGLLATDDDFLNEFLNPTLPPYNNPIESQSPILPYHYSCTDTSSPYLYSTTSVSTDNHSPVSSEGFYSPSWGASTNSNSEVRGVAPLQDTPPSGDSPISEVLLGAPPINSGTSGDVHIDVDMNEDGEEEEEVSPSGSSERKTGSLILSEEEKKLLAEEGIHLPTDMPLTKAEERHLKRIRRKIKNKHSAAESRKRKREYVDGLEKRVEKCTAENIAYKKKVQLLESENKSLLSQLHKLQALVSQYSPSKVQAGSFLMVLMLSFSILVFPSLFSSQSDVYVGSNGVSRTLLNVHTDEFGNIIDPATGQIITDITPLPLPPWKHQSPVLKTFKHSFSSPLSPPSPPLSSSRDL